MKSRYIRKGDNNLNLSSFRIGDFVACRPYSAVTQTQQFLH